MTQPDPAELAAELDAEAVSFEEAAEALAAAGLTAAVTAATVELLGAWATLEGLKLPPRQVAAALRDAAARMLGDIKPELGLGRIIARGVQLGLDHAARLIGAIPPFPLPLRDRELREAVASADRRAADRLAEAVKLARTLPMTRKAHVLAVVGRASSAASQARADARWVANRSYSGGVVGAARAAGLDLVWVAERNACLHCLALSGQVVAPGQLFPGGSFSDHQLTLPLVPFPPRHPNCRCRVQPHHPDDEAFAAGLRREAQRSVARGWSDYDSKPARLRAADRLLRRGSTLPKTVIARAARDVRRGSFSQRHRPLTTLNA